MAAASIKTKRASCCGILACSSCKCYPGSRPDAGPTIIHLLYQAHKEIKDFVGPSGDVSEKMWHSLPPRHASELVAVQTSTACSIHRCLILTWEECARAPRTRPQDTGSVLAGSFSLRLRRSRCSARTEIASHGPNLGPSIRNNQKHVPTQVCMCDRAEKATGAMDFGVSASAMAFSHATG